MSSEISLERLNACAEAEFVDRLGGIFEHSPWVAQQVVDQRPFGTVEALHAAMCDVVGNASSDTRLTLIRNHPELAGKEAAQGQLTAESSREQQGAGLDQCSASELQRLTSLNQAYRQKFDFPFVIAVSGLDRWHIIEQMESRLANDLTTELAASIEQIARIARIRLDQLIVS